MAEEPEEENEVSDRGMSEGFREALEGAFAATGRTRERVQDLTDQVVDEVSRLGQDARGAIAGLGAASGEDLESLEERVELLEQRLAKLERRTGAGDESG